jgi:hypothetical protein
VVLGKVTCSECANISKIKVLIDFISDEDPIPGSHNKHLFNVVHIDMERERKRKRRRKKEGKREKACSAIFFLLEGL